MKTNKHKRTSLTKETRNRLKHDLEIGKTCVELIISPLYDEHFTYDDISIIAKNLSDNGDIIYSDINLLPNADIEKDYLNNEFHDEPKLNNGYATKQYSNDEPDKLENITPESSQIEQFSEYKNLQVILSVNNINTIIVSLQKYDNYDISLSDIQLLNVDDKFRIKFSKRVLISSLQMPTENSNLVHSIPRIRQILKKWILLHKKLSLGIFIGVIIIMFILQSNIISTILLHSASQSGSKDLSNLPIKAIRINKEKVTPTLNVLGVIEYFEKINITSKTSGKIEAIYVDEGMKVRKNQLLIQLDTLPLEIELRKNKAQLEEALSSHRVSKEKLANVEKRVETRLYTIEKLRATAKDLKARLIKAKITYEGKKRLFREEGISKDEFESVKANLISLESQYVAALKDIQMEEVGYKDSDIKAAGYKIPSNKKNKFKKLVQINSRMEKAEEEMMYAAVLSARASLSSTQELLHATSIRSPIDGIVALRNKNVGEYVSGGSAETSNEAILILVNIYDVYAKINLRESDLQYIYENQIIDVKVDAFPEEKLQGKITHISPIVDEQTHTAMVKAILSNKNNKLRPGMFIRSTIITGDPYMAFVVPSKAVIPKEENKALIYTTKNGLVFKNEVTIGKELNDTIEILDGINNGDIVIVDQISLLKDGMKITPDIINL